MPEKIGGYVLRRKLSSSDQADVFEAYKRSPMGFAHRAIIKWLDRRRPEYPVVRRVMFDEARAAGCLCHTNIVKVLDAEEDESGVFIAFEYVPSVDLWKTLRLLYDRQALMPSRIALYVAAEICRGLHHAHSAIGLDNASLNIVHRDMNPTNVLLSYEGTVKIIDFGVAKMSGRLQNETTPGIVKGKMRYLAPEYMQKQSVTPQLDIYGVGLTLFEMLTGRPCFEGETFADILKAIGDGPRYGLLDKGNVSRNVERVLRRALDKNPKKRFAAAEDMLVALEAELDAPTSASSLRDFLRMHEVMPEMVKAPAWRVEEPA